MPNDEPAAATPLDLAPGFYWVRVDGLPPEGARRDAEAREWLLIGSERGVPDGHPAQVEVLRGPLEAPCGN